MHLPSATSTPTPERSRRTAVVGSGVGPADHSRPARDLAERSRGCRLHGRPSRQAGSLASPWLIRATLPRRPTPPEADRRGPGAEPGEAAAAPIGTAAAIA